MEEKGSAQTDGFPQAGKSRHSSPALSPWCEIGDAPPKKPLMSGAFNLSLFTLFKLSAKASLLFLEVKPKRANEWEEWHHWQRLVKFKLKRDCRHWTG